MSTGNDELVRSSFDAFLRGDWDALARVMDPEVQWLWHEPGDWDCHDRKKVLATLFERQREGVVTALHAVIAVDERVFVEVTGPRLERSGLPRGRACMVVTVRNGRIVRMQDYPDRAAARAGAGLPPEPEAAAEPQADLTGDPPRLSPDSPLARRVTEVIRSGDAATLERLLVSTLRSRPPGSVTPSTDSPERCCTSSPTGRGTCRRPARRSPHWSPRALTSTRASPARTARPHCTGRPAATTSTRSTRCSTPVPTSRQTAPSSPAARQSPTPSPSVSGTPHGDCWNAARKPTSGRRLRSGSSDRVQDALAQTPAAQEDLDNALWCAAHGGQRATAELLLNHGADPAWLGHDNLTAAQAADRSDAHELAAWLREQDTKR